MPVIWPVTALLCDDGRFLLTTSIGLPWFERHASGLRFVTSKFASGWRMRPTKG